jgi:hypothetical protein
MKTPAAHIQPAPHSPERRVAAALHEHGLVVRESVKAMLAVIGAHACAARRRRRACVRACARRTSPPHHPGAVVRAASTHAPEAPTPPNGSAELALCRAMSFTTSLSCRNAREPRK